MLRLDEASNSAKSLAKKKKRERENFQIAINTPFIPTEVNIRKVQG